MSWFSRRPATPSREAVESIKADIIGLEEARRLRQESQVVGGALARAHEKNHIAARLEEAIMGRRTAP